MKHHTDELGHVIAHQERQLHSAVPLAHHPHALGIVGKLPQNTHSSPESV